MGSGFRQNEGQVYFDPDKGQYYYASYTDPRTGLGSFNQRNVYIGDPFNQQKTPSSNISNLVQQAMSAQANPISMAQLFPYMNYGATNNMGANMGGMGGLLGLTGTGSSGAGRFLSAPTSTTT